MYVWVILATFLAMLASYTLAPRADMRRITVETLAEAELAKFTAQHHAAYTYVRLHKPPFSGDKKLNNYSPGVVADNTLRNYLPFGYVLSGLYTSQIFCMDDTMSNEIGSGPQGPCNVPGSRKVMVTYGPIPERWVNLSTDPEEPNMDFMNAIRHTGNAGEIVGYTRFDSSAVTDPIFNLSGSKVRVFDGRGIYDSFVPKAVLKNGTYKSVCDLDSNKVCLVSVAGI